MARTDPRPHYGMGRRMRPDGYIDLWAPDHPLARKDGYVFEHRMLAWDAGMFTNPELQVHHRNEDKADNRLDNFEVLTVDEHSRHHAAAGGIHNQYGYWPPERAPRHGTVTEYTRWGCRCEECTAAAVAKARFYRKRQTLGAQ